jgi:hypothetical protein
MEQCDLLTKVLNRVVPAEGAMPACGDLGIANYVDDLLADASHLRRPILDILTEVQTAQAPGELTGEELDEVLGRIERRHRDSFDAMLQAAYTGYYGHPKVLKAIGWVEPEVPAGFDDRLLEAVRRRGPLVVSS